MRAVLKRVSLAAPLVFSFCQSNLELEPFPLWLWQPWQPLKICMEGGEDNWLWRVNQIFPCDEIKLPGERKILPIIQGGGEKQKKK